jgi:glucosamine 6-phosphate synthetase-like amidotransferase/phosphosugar isomerase protein
VPDSDRFLSLSLTTVPARFAAYHMSVARGIHPDLPRNLSTTLTIDRSCVSKPEGLHSISVMNKD